ncbi:MAG: ATP-binding cassette domain-containing protein, partial [Flavobacteriaceae bacterium]|nr:ATP-binding cassette domain-containing protein [Flavobacteriaceae bacterium]
MIGFKVLVTAGLLVIGGFLVLDQEMNIGQFVAAEIIIILIISSVEKLITGLEIFYDLLTSLEKLGEVVDKKLENLDGVDPFETEQDLKINLTNLSVLKWNKESLIENLNLTIDQKDRILFKGPSGSGKTTLLKVIANLISPSGGNISVNGYNLTNVNPNFYRSRVGQVLPEQLPFEGTILENITFGNTEVSMDEVNEVIRVLELEEFLKTQKKGLLTKIFPEGQKIPRTVTMQIMLARAIVGKPKLLILKDALENFEPRLTTKLMAFLAHSDRPWALLVCSNSEEWTQYITREVNLSKQ